MTSINKTQQSRYQQKKLQNYLNRANSPDSINYTKKYANKLISTINGVTGKHASTVPDAISILFRHSKLAEYTICNVTPLGIAQEIYKEISSLLNEFNGLQRQKGEAGLNYVPLFDIMCVTTELLKDQLNEAFSAIRHVKLNEMIEYQKQYLMNQQKNGDLNLNLKNGEYVVFLFSHVHHAESEQNLVTNDDYHTWHLSPNQSTWILLDGEWKVVNLVYPSNGECRTNDESMYPCTPYKIYIYILCTNLFPLNILKRFAV